MKFVVYLLLSKKIPKTYVGYTNNLKNRISCHNKGKVSATRNYRPWVVIYKEFMPLKQKDENYIGKAVPAVEILRES